MPQFSTPWFLLLTLAVPLLIWWRLRQRRGALRHSTAGLLAGLPRGRARVARWGGALLRALSLILLVLALAGPRWPDAVNPVQTEGIALVMLVDVSGSMDEPDFDWRGQPITRLEAVKRVFRLFVVGGSAGPTADGTDASALPGRPADLIGLVTFATRPDDVCPLTLNHSALLQLLENEKPRTLPGESLTNISDAIALGLERAAAAGQRRKVLVLLSDGEHDVPTTRTGWTPRQAAHVAAGLGIPIYVIDAGGNPTDREPGAATSSAASRAEAEKTLKDLAAITHGRYFAARETPALMKACEAIDGLEKAPVDSYQSRRYQEVYPAFALSAFGCWFLVLVLERTWWRSSP
jgi:Ca-activated chloride channel homolog